jgi:hypothetical protein
MTSEGVLNKGITVEEEAKYLPQLVGSDPSKQDWAIKVDNYWKNIAVPIHIKTGRTLEVGIIYPNKETADADEEREVEVRPGIRVTFLTGVGALRPISVADYILYRYCLVYSRVAKSIHEVEASPKIRFYIHSQEEEQKAQKSALELEKDAFKEFIAATTAGKNRVKQILYIMRVDNVASMDEQAAELALHAVMKNTPAKFIEAATDKNLEMKTFIERCITKQLLTRIPNTETIMFDDAPIGNTMNEAIAWCTNEKNKSIVSTLEARLKGLKTS